LINNETDVTPAIGPTANRREPALIANEAHNENMFDTEATNNELPLVGSTRSSNNSIKITKILPKRLRALDTFRGFALMIMIFVNYGGENLPSICLFVFFKFLFILKVVVIRFLITLVKFFFLKYIFKISEFL
jgi:hypothetical protein